MKFLDKMDILWTIFMFSLFIVYPRQLEQCYCLPMVARFQIEIGVKENLEIRLLDFCIFTTSIAALQSWLDRISKNRIPMIFYGNSSGLSLWLAYLIQTLIPLYLLHLCLTNVLLTTMSVVRRMKPTRYQDNIDRFAWLIENMHSPS